MNPANIAAAHIHRLEDEAAAHLRSAIELQGRVARHHRDMRNMIELADAKSRAAGQLRMAKRFAHALDDLLEGIADSEEASPLPRYAPECLAAASRAEALLREYRGEPA